jgi:hypothetical protein
MEVAVTDRPWAGSDGTAKRTLLQSHASEVRV